MTVGTRLPAPLSRVAAGLALAAALACGSGGGGEKAAPVAPPASLAYAPNPAVYTKGLAIPANTPTTTGGAATAYAVSPALPAGLSLNPGSGVISGTPAAVAASASYTVTASNSGGSTATALSLTVNDQAPAGLAYGTPVAVYTRGQAIAPNAPSNTGGAVVSWSVAPALPSGLVLNPATGVVSGTPTALAGTASYVVTATNTGGSTTAALTVTVNDAPPANLAYGDPSPTYFRGLAIPANLPSSTGGAIVQYTVSPTLPAGLVLNPATGVLSGTPTALAASAAYTVTGTNSGGSTSAILQLQVVDAVPAGLTYGTNPATYVKGSPIAPNTPSSTGGLIQAYSVSPALPAGLVLNPGTGVITGTPGALASQATYTVTGSNPSGSTSVGVSIKVIEAPPSALAYKDNPAVYTKDQFITPNVPSHAGGPIAVYSVTPALPTGLALDGSSGVISGVPRVLLPATPYTVTGTGINGESTSVVLTLTINDIAPSITYGSGSFALTTGTPVSLVASNYGGPVLAWAISPALPQGLVFNSTNGTISGNPSVISPDTFYTVTATNSGGTGSVSPSIRVNPPPPVITVQPSPQTVYRGQPATFTVAATGTGALGYQWQKNGAPIPGATEATCILAAPTLEDNQAAISVVVSDPYGGTATSSSTTLTVKSGFTLTGSLIVPRYDHTATLLPSGKVLIAGGYGPEGATAACELYDPATGRFTPTGSMGSPRALHAAVLLANGKVLVSGGVQTDSTILAFQELYDPATGLFTPTGNMSVGRMESSATTLQDGRVLLPGGYTAPVDPTSVDLYDPATGTCTPTGRLAGSARWCGTATLLADGDVVMVGGIGVTPAVEKYHPASSAFLPAGALLKGRFAHTTTLLGSGRLLVVGGMDQNSVELSDPEIYDPATGLSVSVPSPAKTRSYLQSIRLPNGQVLSMGGQFQGAPLDDAELFDPAAQTFTPTQKLRVPHTLFTTTLLTDGSVLIVGGWTPAMGGGGMATCEVYK